MHTLNEFVRSAVLMLIFEMNSMSGRVASTSSRVSSFFQLTLDAASDLQLPDTSTSYVTSGLMGVCLFSPFQLAMYLLLTVGICATQGRFGVCPN